MAFTASRVTVNDTTATMIFEAAAGDVEVEVKGSGTISIGGPGVTTSTSYPASSNGTRFHVRPGDQIWAFSDQTSATAYVLVRSA